MSVPHPRSHTSPWRGEVAEPTGPALLGRPDDRLREVGGGESRSEGFTLPRPAFGRPTLPLQGRVFERGAVA